MQSPRRRVLRLTLMISLVIIVSLAAVFIAQALVLFSNLGPDTDYAYGINTSYSVAAGIHVPAGPRYQVTSITMSVYREAPTGYLVFPYLYSDVGGNPGVQLGAFQPFSVTLFHAYEHITTTPSAPMYLEPNTDYWIVGTSNYTATRGLLWGRTGTAASGLFTYVGFRQNILSGGWTNFATLYPLMLQVDGVEAPIVVDTPTLPPPPPSPLCEDHNFSEGGVVRASTADAFGYAINCRVLYQNGAPTQWLGGNLYGVENLGIPGLVELGIQQAVDIFSPSGVNYFQGGGVFCLRGQGSLIWLAASGAPRHPEIIGNYTVPEFPGFTCATLFEPGTLVLVTETPAS